MSRLARSRVAQIVTAMVAVGTILLGTRPAAAEQSSSPVVDLTFEPTEPRPTGLHFETQFAHPDFTPGVSGRAWRSDGFSSWIGLPLNLSPGGGFTAETWVALESYPSDLETPVENLKPASFMDQATADSGFDVFIDTF